VGSGKKVKAVRRTTHSCKDPTKIRIFAETYTAVKGSGRMRKDGGRVIIEGFMSASLTLDRRARISEC
jgi:hypothetical protein